MANHNPNPLSVAAGTAACKLTRFALRVLGKGGTALPGKAAMVFCKDILAATSRGMKVIIVTGTNGKTTTCRMLVHALEANGYDVLNNSSGANLLSGVTAEFTCGADWLGRPKKKYAVIECDEGALKQVTPLIGPQVIAVTNLFRDQLDRYGEITHTLEAIRTGIERSPGSCIVLNADESLTASIADAVPNRAVFYGVNEPLEPGEGGEISDARYCIHCGAPYRYHYRTYAHLGDFYCEKCGYKRRTPGIAVTKIRSMKSTGSELEMSFGGETCDVQVGLPALYNVYNAVTAAAAYTALGLPRNEILSALSDVRSSFGRMETFTLGGKQLQMILVKNPAGCNQAMSYVRGEDEDFAASFLLNDQTADGHDISWIWDADYEMLAGCEHLKKIYVSGERAHDMALRLKYAGFAEEQIELVENLDDLVKILRECKLPVFCLPNYTSMLALRARLRDEVGAADFWNT